MLAVIQMLSGTEQAISSRKSWFTNPFIIRKDVYFLPNSTQENWKERNCLHFKIIGGELLVFFVWKKCGP